MESIEMDGGLGEMRDEKGKKLAVEMGDKLDREVRMGDKLDQEVRMGDKHEQGGQSRQRMLKRRQRQGMKERDGKSEAMGRKGDVVVGERVIK